MVGNPAEEYLPSKYIPGGATYRARAVMEMPLSVEDALWLAGNSSPMTDPNGAAIYIYGNMDPINIPQSC